MQPASSALTLAASPSALTLTALRDALAAEAAYQAAQAVCRPSRLAANAARDLALEHKRRKSLLTASDAAEALADATAAACGYSAKADHASATRSALARHLCADRFLALGYGPMWTGCGYAEVAAQAIRDTRRDGGFAGSFAALGDVARITAAGAEVDAVDVALSWDAWQGEVRGFDVRVHVRDTRRNGEPYVRTCDLYHVRAAELNTYREGRGAVSLGTTGTTFAAADAAAVSDAAQLTAALIALAERYAAAHPARTPREDAADLIAAGGVWRDPLDAPEVLRGVDPRA